MTEAEGLVDRRAVVVGAGAALAIIAPVIIVVEILDATIGIAADSDVVFIPYVLILLGFVTGGWLAAKARVDAPLTHGALAAVSAYVVVAVAVTVSRVVGDSSVSVGETIVNLIFNALIAASAGLVGGLIVTRRRYR